MSRTPDKLHLSVALARSRGAEETNQETGHIAKIRCTVNLQRRQLAINWLYCCRQCSFSNQEMRLPTF